MSPMLSRINDEEKLRRLYVAAVVTVCFLVVVVLWGRV